MLPLKKKKSQQQQQQQSPSPIENTTSAVAASDLAKILRASWGGGLISATGAESSAAPIGSSTQQQHNSLGTAAASASSTSAATGAAAQWSAPRRNKRSASITQPLWLREEVVKEREADEQLRRQAREGRSSGKQPTAIGRAGLSGATAMAATAAAVDDASSSARRSQSPSSVALSSPSAASLGGSTSSNNRKLTLTSTVEKLSIVHSCLQGFATAAAAKKRTRNAMTAAGGAGAARKPAQQQPPAFNGAATSSAVSLLSASASSVDDDADDDHPDDLSHTSAGTRSSSTHNNNSNNSSRKRTQEQQLSMSPFSAIAEASVSTVRSSSSGTHTFLQQMQQMQQQSVLFGDFSSSNQQHDEGDDAAGITNKQIPVADLLSPLTKNRPPLHHVPYQKRVAEEFGLTSSSSPASLAAVAAKANASGASAAARRAKLSFTRRHDEDDDDADHYAGRNNQNNKKKNINSSAAIAHVSASYRSSDIFSSTLHQQDPKRFTGSWKKRKQADDGADGNNHQQRQGEDNHNNHNNTLSTTVTSATGSNGAAAGTGAGTDKHHRKSFASTLIALNRAIAGELSPSSSSSAGGGGGPSLFGFLPRKFVRAAKEWHARARERITDRNAAPLIDWHRARCDRATLLQLFTNWNRNVYALRHFRRSTMRQCFWALAQNAAEEKALFVQQREVTEAVMMRYKVRRIFCVWHRMMLLNAIWMKTGSEEEVNKAVNKMLQTRRNPEFSYLAHDCVEMGSSQSALKAAARSLPATKAYLIKVLGAWHGLCVERKKWRANVARLQDWVSVSQERRHRAATGGLIGTREVLNRWQRAWHMQLASRFHLVWLERHAFQQWKRKRRRMHSDQVFTQRVHKMRNERLVSQVFFKWQNKFDEAKALDLLGFARIARARETLLPYMLRLLGRDDDRRLYIADTFARWRKFLNRRRVFCVFVCQQVVEYDFALKRRAFAVWRNTARNSSAVEWHTGVVHDIAQRLPPSSQASGSFSFPQDDPTTTSVFPSPAASVRNNNNKHDHRCRSQSQASSHSGKDDKDGGATTTAPTIVDIDDTKSVMSVARSRTGGGGGGTQKSSLGRGGGGGSTSGAYHHGGGGGGTGNIFHVLLPRHTGGPQVGTLGGGRHWSLAPPVHFTTLRHRASALLKIDSLQSVPSSDRLVILVATPSDVLPAQWERPTAAHLEQVHRVAHLPMQALRPIVDAALHASVSLSSGGTHTHHNTSSNATNIDINAVASSSFRRFLRCRVAQAVFMHRVMRKAAENARSTLKFRESSAQSDAVVQIMQQLASMVLMQQQAAREAMWALPPAAPGAPGSAFGGGGGGTIRGNNFASLQQQQHQQHQQQGAGGVKKKRGTFSGGGAGDLLLSMNSQNSGSSGFDPDQLIAQHLHYAGAYAAATSAPGSSLTQLNSHILGRQQEEAAARFRNRLHIVPSDNASVASFAGSFAGAAGVAAMHHHHHHHHQHYSAGGGGGGVGGGGATSDIYSGAASDVASVAGGGDHHLHHHHHGRAHHQQQQQQQQSQHHRQSQQQTGVAGVLMDPRDCWHVTLKERARAEYMKRCQAERRAHAKAQRNIKLEDVVIQIKEELPHEAFAGARPLEKILAEYVLRCIIKGQQAQLKGRMLDYITRVRYDVVGIVAERRQAMLQTNPQRRFLSTVMEEKRVELDAKLQRRVRQLAVIITSSDDDDDDADVDEETKQQRRRKKAMELRIPSRPTTAPGARAQRPTAINAAAAAASARNPPTRANTTVAGTAPSSVSFLFAQAMQTSPPATAGSSNQSAVVVTARDIALGRLPVPPSAAAGSSSTATTSVFHSSSSSVWSAQAMRAAATAAAIWRGKVTASKLRKQTLPSNLLDIADEGVLMCLPRLFRTRGIIEDDEPPSAGAAMAGLFGPRKSTTTGGAGAANKNNNNNRGRYGSKVGGKSAKSRVSVVDPSVKDKSDYQSVKSAQ